jgi:hypothetical protein
MKLQNKNKKCPRISTEALNQFVILQNNYCIIKQHRTLRRTIIEPSGKRFSTIFKSKEVIIR